MSLLLSFIVLHLPTVHSNGYVLFLVSIYVFSRSFLTVLSLSLPFLFLSSISPSSALFFRSFPSFPLCIHLPLYVHTFSSPLPACLLPTPLSSPSRISSFPKLCPLFFSSCPAFHFNFAHPTQNAPCLSSPPLALLSIFSSSFSSSPFPIYSNVSSPYSHPPALNFLYPIITT